MSDPTGTDQRPTPDMREERRVVTVVFADLAGSTELGESLDPEEVKLVIGEAVGRIVQAVESFGGTVKDLAGDGVLALFGAPRSHEDDGERAIRAGLRIVHEMGAYAVEVERAWGIQGFGIRVGVNTGPVVLGSIGAGQRVEYAAFGDTVNTAARLQSAASVGEVLAGAATHRLTELLFDWDGPRVVTLKGKTESVRAYAVAGARSATARVVRDGLQAWLVGRDRELAAVSEALDGVLAGRGGILFITGEAGIGKSRLMLEARERFLGAGPGFGERLWVEGRCVSYGESLPYWLYRDLLREWLGACADEPELRVRISLRRGVEALFGVRTPEIYPYLGALMGLALEPEAAARLEGLSPEALQYRTFEVVWSLLAALAQKGPVVVAIEDLHWADATSIQLTERLMGLTEEAPVLFIIAQRSERDHPSWRTKERAERELPHRTGSLPLEALSGAAERELLYALVGAGTLPPDLEERVLGDAEGNPFYLEEIVRSLADEGALVRDETEGPGRWRFDHAVPFAVPGTVEKVILARIDRLPARCHEVLTAASVLGRRFGLPLLEGVSGGNGNIRESLSELQRLDLIREGRRWPQPEYRFKHALIQEAAYRTILSEHRIRLHRRAAEWLEDHHSGHEDEVFGLLAHHWLAAEDEDKAVDYLSRAGDKARQEYALDEAIGHYQALLPILERRSERQSMAFVLFKLALSLHGSLRFAEANQTYQRAFDLWTPPSQIASPPTATLRMATSFLPGDPDPKSAIAWPNIQLCMQLFDRLVEAWPERTIVPSLAERWEISDDGLRYVFHLRAGLRWSDGVPLTAGDVEFGIKRVLNPKDPGSSVAIYFVLENGQDYYLGRNQDADRIGVRALDDRTVEFRLVAPAPYFMGVMNRPDAGPQPRHAIDRDGSAWTDPRRQVVSGPFRVAGRTDDLLTLERRPEYAGPRPGNVARVEEVRSVVGDAIGAYGRDELDLVAVRYTPRLADLMPAEVSDATLGAAGWSGYLAFDHSHAAVANLELRLALAHAVNRGTLAEAMPLNMVVAAGGIVPPALQGHTPDIALRFDPDLAREHLQRSGFSGALDVGCLDDDLPVIHPVIDGWREELGLDVRVVTWTLASAPGLGALRKVAPIYFTGWLPGYADPEYFLRLLFHSESKTNEGGFSYPAFDDMIERARQERRDRDRLELFHSADRMAVAERVAVIPLVYGRSLAIVKPWIRGWWEFGKSSSNFADLDVDPSSPRA